MASFTATLLQIMLPTSSATDPDQAQIAHRVLKLSPPHEQACKPSHTLKSHHIPQVRSSLYIQGALINREEIVAHLGTFYSCAFLPVKWLGPQEQLENRILESGWDSLPDQIQCPANSGQTLFISRETRNTIPLKPSARMYFLVFENFIHFFPPIQYFPSVQVVFLLNFLSFAPLDQQAAEGWCVCD